MLCTFVCLKDVSSTGDIATINHIYDDASKVYIKTYASDCKHRDEWYYRCSGCHRSSQGDKNTTFFGDYGKHILKGHSHLWKDDNGNIVDSGNSDRTSDEIIPFNKGGAGTCYNKIKHYTEESKFTINIDPQTAMGNNRKFSGSFNKFKNQFDKCCTYTNSKGKQTNYSKCIDYCRELMKTNSLVNIEAHPSNEDSSKTSIDFVILGYTLSCEKLSYATCTQDEHDYCICSVCGKEADNGKIKALGHTLGSWTSYPASCKGPVTNYQYCGRGCGTVVNTSTLAQLPHSGCNWEQLTEVIKTQDGWYDLNSTTNEATMWNAKLDIVCMQYKIPVVNLSWINNPAIGKYTRTIDGKTYYCTEDHNAYVKAATSSATSPDGCYKGTWNIHITRDAKPDKGEWNSPAKYHISFARYTIYARHCTSCGAQY